jgi:hypothetical protein
MTLQMETMPSVAGGGRLGVWEDMVVVVVSGSKQDFFSLLFFFLHLPTTSPP